MAQVSFTDCAPFVGWTTLRATLTTLGPMRVLRVLMKSVRAEMDEDDGCFRGDSVHNYVNHPLVARAALKLAVELDPSLASGDADSDALSVEQGEDLRLVLRQVNELARSSLQARRPANFDRTPRFSQEHVERIVDILWVETLRGRGRANSFKHELGRAWLLLRTYWIDRRAEVKGAVDLSLADPLDTVFDSMECAIALVVALLHFGGRMEDARTTLAGTAFAGHLEAVLGWYAQPAGAVVGDWVDIELFASRGIDGAFQSEPVVRLGEFGLIAPDLAMALSGIADRALSRGLANYANNGAKALESARTVLGLVFERHVQSLVEECALNSASSRFENEFKLADTTDSPDAFLVSGSEVCAFEAKATRYPAPVHDHLDRSAFLQWLREVTGERPATNRAPLEQGARFVERWRLGDATAVAKLGTHAPNTFWYVIVVHEDLPPFVHWERFRDLMWRPKLGARERALDARTLFISIRDLEALVAALAWLRDVGRSSDAARVLTEWRAVWDCDEEIASSRELKPSLRSYVLGRFPRSAGYIPVSLSSAFRECWTATGEALFG